MPQAVPVTAAMFIKPRVPLFHLKEDMWYLNAGIESAGAFRRFQAYPGCV